MGVVVWSNGTGFGNYSIVTTITETNTTTGETTVATTKQEQLGKTLWDWMQLLIIPAVLATGAVYFNRAERRNELQIAEQRADNAVLQTYLDQMTNLLLQEKLGESQPGSVKRDVGRIRTLTAIKQLSSSSDKQNTIIGFLHDAKLIGLGGNNIIDFRKVDFSYTTLYSIVLSAINFQGANFTLAKLNSAKLQGADLRGTNFKYADLSGADLSGADLDGANLDGANLQSATLERTNLRNTNITQEQLEYCSTVAGATMPDGSKVPDDQEFPPRWRRRWK